MQVSSLHPSNAVFPILVTLSGIVMLVSPIDVIAKLQLKGLNVNVGTFSKVENGYDNPSVDLLIALTDILGSDFNAFFKHCSIFNTKK